MTLISIFGWLCSIVFSWLFFLFYFLYKEAAAGEKKYFQLYIDLLGARALEAQKELNDLTSKGLNDRDKYAKFRN